jgi:hypothetical protein
MFLTVATGWFRFWNYHEFQWIVSNTKPKDVIPDCSTIWFGLYHPHPPQQPAMNNTSTRWVFWIKLHFCKFLSLVRRPCQHLPTSAYSTSLSYPGGRYPPDMCISDAVRRSKDGQARFPKFCDAAMLLLFCYHVISCLWYLSQVNRCAYHKDQWESLRVKRVNRDTDDTVSKKQLWDLSETYTW